MLRFAATRISDAPAVQRLANSIEANGQLVECVAAGQAADVGLVLIDGYQRVEAARRAGIDTLKAQIWPQPAPDAVCQLLASDGARQLDVLGQAGLLGEVKLTHRMSQNEMALRMGRHPSWVSRRLMIIEQLPEAVLEAVRASRCATASSAGWESDEAP